MKETINKNTYSKEQLCKRISALRKKKKYTQTELAKKIKSTQKLISDYEIGRVRPNPEIIVKLAIAFGVSTDELLGLKDIRLIDNKPDKKITQRIKEIEKLSTSEQKFVLRAIDALIISAKVKNQEEDNL